VFTDAQHHDSLKLAVVKKICAPLCHHMSLMYATDVFSDCIGPLMDLISNEEVDFSSGKTSSNEELSAVLVNHICSLHLINTLYECLPAKTIRDNINLKYCQHLNKTDIKGNELTTAIMRLAHGAKTKELQRLGLDDKLIRDYQCTAYNTLAAVVICTQTKEQFFTVFFFKENPKKNERIWSNIVDLRVLYSARAHTHTLTLTLTCTAK
jgi:DNA-dependent protein kinase catalytic subunit